MPVTRKDEKKDDSATETVQRREAADTNPEGQDEVSTRQEDLREQVGDIKFFEGMVAKVTKDGQVVMSDHLLPGEITQREADERVPDEEKRAKAAKRRRDAERRWHREDRDDEHTAK